MGSLWQFVVDFLREAWPLRHVQGWERGIFTVLNRPCRYLRYPNPLPPGLWPIVPMLMDVRAVSVVPAVVRGGRQDITLSDGTPVSFRVTAEVEVTDPQLAIYAVDQFQETTQEKLEVMAAHALGEEDLESFATARQRATFLRRLARTVNTETEQFGVRVHSVGFRDFTLRLRTYRLLSGDDGSQMTSTW